MAVRKKFPKALLIFAVLITALIILKWAVSYFLFSAGAPDVPPGVSINPPDKNKVENAKDIEVVAENLEIPWELVFLPGGDMLLTERPGNLVRITAEKKVIRIEGVSHSGEGGLLGLALDPSIESNGFIYIYYTYKNSGQLMNKVVRYRLDGNSLDSEKTIIDGIRGSSNHDGGRIRFGPDGFLYISTGDAENPSSAQDKNSLNGKILRVGKDGSIPSDNPFGNAVYSYGHRNIQGIAWDNTGNLWATEHGPSGSQTGNDEINLIKKGGNYGWPDIKGMEKKDGMESPVMESGKSNTWAPSGLLVYKDNLFFAGLRGQSLFQAKIGGSGLSGLKANFKNEYGRLRDIVIGPDNYFYLLTNNRDGRGKAGKSDDRIIKINPEIFFK